MPSYLFFLVFGLLELRQRQRNNDIIGQRQWSILKRKGVGWGAHRAGSLSVIR